MKTRTKNSKKNNRYILPFQVILSIGGVAAGDLYRQASIACTKLDVGRWLANITPRSASTIYWIAGGGDFAFMNAYFSFAAVPKITEAIESSKTITGKIAASVFIIGVACPKFANQYFMVSSQPESSHLDVILSLGGAAPGNLYGAANMFCTDIPRIDSWIRNSSAFNCLRTHNENEYIAHYKQEQNLFNKRMEMNWLKILELFKQKELFIDVNKDHLEFLFENKQKIPDSFFYDKSRFLFQTLAWSGTAAPVLGTIIANIYNGLGKYFPDSLFYRTALTAAIVGADIYLISKLIAKGAGDLFDNVRNLIFGKPIDWLIFQIYPKMSLLLLGANIATASISYALLAVLFTKNYPEDWLFKNDKQDLIWFPIMGINLFHLVGLLHCCAMVVESYTKHTDEKSQYLFDVHHSMDTFKEMRLEDFIEFITNPDNVINYAELCGVDTRGSTGLNTKFLSRFEPNCLHTKQRNSKASDPEIGSNAESIEDNDANLPKRTQFSRFLGFFSGDNNTNKDAAEPLLSKENKEDEIENSNNEEQTRYSPCPSSCVIL